MKETKPKHFRMLTLLTQVYFKPSPVPLKASSNLNVPVKYLRFAKCLGAVLRPLTQLQNKPEK